MVAFGQLQVLDDHFLHQPVEAGFCHPAEFLTRLAGIAEQRLHLGRPEIARVHRDDAPAAGGVDALLVFPFALQATSMPRCAAARATNSLTEY